MKTHPMRRQILAATLAAMAATSLGAAGVGGAQAEDGPRFLISTDYGLGVIGGATNGPDRHAADVDDAYAVSLALTGGEVLGLVTTFGNAKAKPSADSARRGLAALGIPDVDALVTVGSEGFLDAEAVTFVPSDDDGDAGPPFCLNAGVERMAAILGAQEAGTVTLVAIGPFTDIACLLRADPDAFARLGAIVALVGSSDGQPVLGGIDVVDFNFAMDPTALGEVIAGDHSVDTTFMMIEVTQLGTLTNEVLASWVDGDDAARRFYGAASQPHAAYWDAIFTGVDGQALFDAHTVHYALGPDAYVCEDDMVATAIVGGYPDTSASTTKNSLAVASADGASTAAGVSVDGSTYTYTGSVRGCSAFADDDGVSTFEAAVAASITSVEGPPADDGS